MQIILDKRISLVNGTLAIVKKCACPDDKLSHTFQVKALEFDNEKGINITVKVFR